MPSLGLSAKNLLPLALSVSVNGRLLAISASPFRIAGLSKIYSTHHHHTGKVIMKLEMDKKRNKCPWVV
jgi:hypothetical protein